MHNHLGSMLWFEIGRYGGLALLIIASWLYRQRWFPHRHDGYVAGSGYVHTCSVCGKLPAIDDPVTCPRCGDMRGRPAAWAATGYETSHCATCYLALRKDAHLWELTAYSRGDGFHYARRRSTDAVERHYDGQPCACPNAPEYSREAGYARLLSAAFQAGYRRPQTSAEPGCGTD